MNLIRYLKKQPGWMLTAVILIIACISVMAVYAGKIKNELFEYKHTYSNKFDGERVYLMTAIQTYIAESEDIQLFFDKNESVKSVEELLNNLRRKVVYKGKEYGPYINAPIPDYTEDHTLKKVGGTEENHGWKVIIDRTGSVNIFLDDKNTVNYVDDISNVTYSKDLRSGWHAQKNHLELLQKIIIFSDFVLWNLLSLFCSLIVFDLARKFTILKFAANVFLSIIIPVTFILLLYMLFKDGIISYTGIFLFYVLWSVIFNFLNYRILSKEEDFKEFKNMNEVSIFTPAVLFLLMGAFF